MSTVTPIPAGDLISRAGRLGLLTQRERHGDNVGVQGPLGCRHVGSIAQTYAVTVCRHPVGYVKVGPSLQRERTVLAALTERECTAEMVLDPERSASDQLWTAVAGETRLGDVRGTAADLAEICQAWGAALGRLHTTSVRTGWGATTLRPPRAHPWVLDERALTRSLVRGPAASRFAGIVQSLETRPLRTAAAEVAERWTAQHWVHGDLRPEHVLVSTAGGARVRFVGLGSAGLGDTAWDLAAAYDGLETMATAWSSSPALGIDYFLQGYRHAGGPARVYPAMRAVHALAAAWAHAEAGASPAVVDRWVERARGHADRRWSTGLAA